MAADTSTRMDNGWPMDKENYKSLAAQWTTIDETGILIWRKELTGWMHNEMDRNGKLFLSDILIPYV